jgi:DNA primase
MTIEELGRLLEYLGIERLKQRGNQWTGLCPLHTESRPSFGVSAEKLLYNCYSCKAAGSLVDLVSRILKVSPEEAKQIISRYGACGIDVLHGKDLLSFGEKKVIDKFVPEAVYAPYITESRKEKAKAYLEGRGVLYRKSSTVSEVGLDFGYDPKTERVLFPWLDMNRRFQGCTGRTVVDNDARYISFFGLTRGDHLFFGCHTDEWFDMFDSGLTEHVVIVEGEIDAVLVTQTWAKTKCIALATGSSSASYKQVGLLTRLGSSYVDGFDNDASGLSGSTGLVYKLKKNGIYGGKILWKHKDAGACSLEERVKCLRKINRTLLCF